MSLKVDLLSGDRLTYDTMKNGILIFFLSVIAVPVVFAQQTNLTDKSPVEHAVAGMENIKLSMLTEAYPKISDKIEAEEKEIFSRLAEQARDAGKEESNTRSYGSEETKFVDLILWGVSSNAKVNHFLNYFKTKARESFKIWLSRSSQYLPAINKIFEEHGIAEELVFLPLIESGFSPYATSRAQAAGIWQFMKGTAKRYGLRVDRFIDERRDPEKSAKAAAMYLKDLYGIFGSWDFALAAYNAGEGKIMRVKNSSKSDDFWDVIAHRKIKRETKEYVPRFVAATLIAKEPKEHGFHDVNYQSLAEVEEVLLPPKTTLKSVAEITGVVIAEIKALNPAIKNGFLPPDRHYTVRIPKDKAALLNENLDQLKKADEKTIKKILAKKEPKKKYSKKSNEARKSYKKIADAKRIYSDRRS